MENTIHFFRTKRAHRFSAINCSSSEYRLLTFMPMTELTVRELVEGCATESRSYHQGASHNQRYCVELFRRAIADRNEEAWSAIFTQYEGLVIHWVCSKNIPAIREYPDPLVNEAFARFWRSKKPDGLIRDGNLGAILQYLKMCALSAVIDYTRLQKTHSPPEPRDESIPDNAERKPGGTDPPSTIISRETTERLWRVIDQLLKSDKERLVIECTFVFDMPPREISAEFPDVFPDRREIFRVKENVMKRLRRSPELKAFLPGK
ncbi:MAG: sigma-70 family RNA polymerase sigma factor [Anaerolineae bacterium]|nr:sigma-70 family RNA polymerase sigma factor [Anaerolineae bacterium]